MERRAAAAISAAPPGAALLTDLGAAAAAATSQSLWLLVLSRLRRGKSMQLREADGGALTSAAEDRTAEWTRRQIDGRRPQRRIGLIFWLSQT